MDYVEPLIFISYTVKDRERVIPYYDYLISQGHDVWMDHRRIKPGQNWDFEIKRALSKATIIVLFVSSNSVTRRGYIQREIKAALDKSSEKLIDDIYLIPVLLDDTATIPDELKGVQFTRESSEACMTDIDDAIKHQIDSLKQNTPQSLNQSGLKWYRTPYRDTWNGIPGFDIEAQMLHIKSDEYARAGEIGEYVNGWLLGSMMGFRQCLLQPDIENYNYGQERQRRTNTYDASFGDMHIVGKIVSASYSIHTYYARAAHPNMSYKTFAFLIEPLISISSLDQIFREPDQAIETIREMVREELYKPREYIDGNEETEIEPDRGWVDRGTQDWDDLASFIFKEDAIEILFEAYQVGSYAEGPQSADIAYSRIWPLIKDEYLSALDKDHLQYRMSEKAAGVACDAMQDDDPQ